MSHQQVPILCKSRNPKLQQSYILGTVHSSKDKIMGNLCLAVFSFSNNNFCCTYFWSTSKWKHVFSAYIDSLQPGLTLHPGGWQQPCFLWLGNLVSHQLLQFFLLNPTTAELSSSECPLAGPSVVRKVSQSSLGGWLVRKSQQLEMSKLHRSGKSNFAGRGKLSSQFKQGVLFCLGEGITALKQVLMKDTSLVTVQVQLVH